MHSSILKIKTTANTWTFVTDIVNICLYYTQCNKYTYILPSNILLSFLSECSTNQDERYVSRTPETRIILGGPCGFHIILLWVFVGTIWYSSLWSKRRVGSRPEASPQLSYSHKLGLKSWKTYFHILKSAFSYSIFWQTQFETSFWLSIFIGDINFSIRWLMNWLVGTHPRQPNG